MVPPHYQMPIGGQRSINIVTVGYPFTGSEEVFCYRGNGSSLAMASIFLPESNMIEVEVQLPSVTKDAAINAANRSMETTHALIAQNNPDVERWRAQMESKIDALTEQKRKEILDLFS